MVVREVCVPQSKCGRRTSEQGREKGKPRTTRDKIIENISGKRNLTVDKAKEMVENKTK